MPRLIEVDLVNERLLKEYIEGDTVFDMVIHSTVTDKHFDDIRETCRLLYAANTNIDYFPTNFVENNGLLYYVDYECNDLCLIGILKIGAKSIGVALPNLNNI